MEKKKNIILVDILFKIIILVGLIGLSICSIGILIEFYLIESPSPTENEVKIEASNILEHNNIIFEYGEKFDNFYIATIYDVQNEEYYILVYKSGKFEKLIPVDYL